MQLVMAMVLFVSFNASANSGFGKILKVQGKKDSLITRKDQKLAAKKDFSLELQDKVLTNNDSVTVLIRPESKMIVHPNSEIIFSDKNILDFINGAIWVSLKKEFKVQADGVSFVAKNAEFEVSEGTDSIDLDVIQGEVTVSSPYVQTFVPEIVKAKEGFSFGKTKKNFGRRQFSSKIK